MSSTTVLRVTEKRMAADTAIMDNMVHLQRNNENGEKKRKKAVARKADGRGKEEEA